MIIGIDGNEANLETRVGVNQYAAQLLRALERLPQAKRHVWIIYLKEPPLAHLPRQRAGWKYKVLRGRGLWVLRKLTPYLWFTKERPDVFFTPSHYTPPFLPILLVMSVMDLGYLRFPQQFRKYDFYQLKYWGAWSMRRARRIIAISESTKREIIKHYPWAKGKIEVTYLAYDKTRFNTKVSEGDIGKVKKKYGISRDYILFLSTLKPSKNVEGLLEAFSLLVANGSGVGQKAANIKLVIAGKKGWLYDTIFRRVQDLRLEEKVIFTDFVPEEDKPGLLAGAKALVSPSFWEGFGMHVLEAMACGTPVVVSNVGSFPETVGNAGILVDPYSPESIAEGLERVVSMPENRYNKLREQVLRQAGKFSWEKTAKEALKILEKAYGNI